MPTTTIQIPAGHVEAIRQSLLGRRDHAEREAIDSLLGQIPDGASDDARSCELTGPRSVLWNAIYDALCLAAEQLADDCNEYWRGEVTPDAARSAVASVGTRLELLVALGGPPGG